jgi:uncharacterized membrane protein YuzA (DUF378 family)
MFLSDAVFFFFFRAYYPARKPAKPAPERSIAMLDRISLILVIIGAINWLLVGLFSFDVVAYAFGGQTAVVSRVIYTLVGVAGLWCISLLFREREVEHES